MRMAGRKTGLGCGLAMALSLTGVACSSSTDEASGTGGQTSNTGGVPNAGGASTSGGAGGSTAGGSSGTGDTSSTGGTSGSSTAVIGTFQVQLVPPDASLGTAGATKIVGKVSDGPTPSNIVWETSQTDGSCVLEKPRVPFCDPACGGDVCVDDDHCQAYPTAKSVGTVTVTGVSNNAGASFTMQPVAGNYQPGAGITIDYPGTDPATTVTFATSGGDLAAFAIDAKGIAPLALADTALTLEADKALSLKWTAPATAGQSKIHVKLDVSHHGGTKGMIECDADDNGALDISAALVTKLLALGAAGFPTIIVTRTSTGAAQTEKGKVELDIVSPVEREVTIPGVVSCDGDADCDQGKTCQSDLTCA
jgi:hypothetical protein